MTNPNLNPELNSPDAIPLPTVPTQIHELNNPNQMSGKVTHHASVVHQTTSYPPR